MPGSRSAHVAVWQCPIESPEAEQLVRTYLAEVVSRYYGRPASEAEIDTALLDDPGESLKPPRGVFLLARSEARFVGCVGLGPLTPDVLEMKRMFVLPAFRGRGIAARLLAAAEEVARGRAATAIRLDTRRDLVAAQRLYRSSGYTEIPAYHHGPHADVFFEKRLRCGSAPGLR